VEGEGKKTGKERESGWRGKERIRWNPPQTCHHHYLTKNYAPINEPGNSRW